MRKLIAATAALALAMPVAVVPTAPAQAQSHYKGKSSKSRTYYKKCRRSTGTAGLVGAGQGEGAHRPGDSARCDFCRITAQSSPIESS